MNSDSNKKKSTEASFSNQTPALTSISALPLKTVPLSYISQAVIPLSDPKINPSNKKAPKPSNIKKSYP